MPWQESTLQKQAGRRFYNRLIGAPRIGKQRIYDPYTGNSNKDMQYRNNLQQQVMGQHIGKALQDVQQPSQENIQQALPQASQQMAAPEEQKINKRKAFDTAHKDYISKLDSWRAQLKAGQIPR